jgi:hypothetical protein
MPSRSVRAPAGIPSHNVFWGVRRLGCPLFRVNGKPLGELRSEWRRACEKTGVPCGRKGGGFVLHSGHRTPSVHARYLITAERTQADAVDKAEAAVARLARPA